MNKKFSPLFFGPFVFAFAALAMAGSDSWEIGKAKPAASDGKIRIPGTGQRTIMLDDPGVAVVDDPESTSGKALSFNGTQAKPVLVSGGPYEKTDSVLLNVNLKPAGDSTEEGTVICHPGSYELRMSTGARELRFYVTGKEKAPAVMVRAKVTPNEWNTVEATVKGQAITLTVNQQTTSGVIPDGAVMNPAESFLRIGRMDAARPYKGLLGDLTVAEPAE